MVLRGALLSAYLVPVEERLEVVEAERAARRDRLCRIASPEQTIRVPAEGTQY